MEIGSPICRLDQTSRQNVYVRNTKMLHKKISRGIAIQTGRLEEVEKDYEMTLAGLKNL